MVGVVKVGVDVSGGCRDVVRNQEAVTNGQVVDAGAIGKVGGTNGRHRFAVLGLDHGEALGDHALVQDGNPVGHFFLAGPDSDYITGQTLEVDGGMQFH